MIIVPQTPTPPPSPQAQELGLKIAALVRVLRQQDPTIGVADVFQGLQLARSELRAELGGGRGPVLVLAVALGLAALLGVLVAVRGLPLGQPWLIAFVVGLLAVVGALVAVTRRA